MKSMVSRLGCSDFQKADFFSFQSLRTALKEYNVFGIYPDRNKIQIIFGNV